MPYTHINKQNIICYIKYATLLYVITLKTRLTCQKKKRLYFIPVFVYTHIKVKLKKGRKEMTPPKPNYTCRLFLFDAQHINAYCFIHLFTTNVIHNMTESVCIKWLYYLLRANKFKLYHIPQSTKTQRYETVHEKLV